ncbi:PREDICTED: sororin [Nanorana parkeri]|uniref:sororin n=1 Tax=Nanorana parkeri TaxID=125878 RepID=UPI00085432E4|nr:PREDICTED: sororin [Nanorana parkeri]
MSDRKKRGSSRGTVTCKRDSITSPPARRSGRNSLNKSTDSPKPTPVMKVLITAKKIMPRKTLAALASAESQPKTTSTVQQPTTAVATPQSTPKVSSGVTPALRRSSRISPNSEKENTVNDKSQDVHNKATDQSLVSKIDVLSPIPLNIPQSPSYDDRAKVMSQKVRRSYSRLEMSMCGGSFLYSPNRDTDSSDTSTPNPAPKAGRRSLFGFDNLLTSESPEEEAEQKRDEEKRKQTNIESVIGKSIRLSVEEPDPNIPGVPLAKQKRRKRKAPQIEKSDLDEWAATLNAQFEEAEKFDLVVE